MKKLRIGVISYANLFPIIHTLKNQSDCSEYEFIEGVPSDLNRQIRNAEIEVSPSSSVEYLRNRSQYDLIRCHSISSSGPVKSILLFSRLPLESLDEHTVFTSSQSETSVVMMRIIFERFYGIRPSFRSTSEPLASILERSDACLSIGDEALTSTHLRPDMFRYDIGELWYRNTGLPSVFALWIARKGCCVEAPELFDRFIKDLDHAKEEALKDFSGIANFSPLLGALMVDELVAYWKTISYSFDKAEQEGLALFERYASEMKLL